MPIITAETDGALLTEFLTLNTGESPQRRRRIHLVLDLRGECARKVLFEREGLRGYFEKGGKAWERASANTEDRIGTDDRTGEGFDGYNGDLTGDVSSTLGVNCGMSTGRNGVIECRGRQMDAVGCDLYNLAVSGDKAVSLTANTGTSCTHSGPTVAIPYTLKIRSGCEGGGKGALIQTDKSATLSTLNDQYLFQPVQVICSSGDVAGTLDASYYKGCGMRQGVERDYVVERYLFENHSQDTRYKGPLDVCPMLPAQLGTGGNNAPFVVEKPPVYCLQGNGIDRADTAGCNGKGWKEDVGYTLNTIDRPAVAYRQGGFADYVEGELGTLKASGGDLGGGSENLIVDQIPRYIVRRLTPTECARLQGFPDTWGHPDHKDDFTEEEVAFWNEVRNTHAAINGKPTKDYTKERLLTWYNKLHTDSAEYKMWGNGIALPPALYVMEGIKDALEAANESIGSM